MLAALGCGGRSGWVVLSRLGFIVTPPPLFVLFSYPTCDTIAQACEPDPFAPVSHKHDMLMGVFKLWSTQDTLQSVGATLATLTGGSGTTDTVETALLEKGAAQGRFLLTTTADWLLWIAVVVHIYTMRRQGVWGGRYPSSFHAPKPHLDRPGGSAAQPTAPTLVRGWCSRARLQGLVSRALDQARGYITALIVEFHVLLAPDKPWPALHWKPRQKVRRCFPLCVYRVFVCLVCGVACYVVLCHVLCS